MTAYALKGRSWLSTYETAQYLSEETKTRWLEADIFQAAIEGRLPLIIKLPTGTKDRAGRPIDGVCGVPMEGAAKQQIDHNYHTCLLGGSYVGTIDNIDGATVVSPDGERRQLQPQRGGTVSSSAFPQGHSLGVRGAALNDFIKQLPDSAADDLDKPLGERERTTLLAIIAAMAEESEIDLSHPSTAASSVVAKLQLMGIRLGKTTVEVHLKKAIEASEKLKQ